jgi:uncharacterized protein YktB (UPF0637 family)
MTKLDELFEARVRSAVAKCRELGYNPNDFQQMLDSSNAVTLAQKLVTSGNIQSGLKKLSSLGKPELSIESIMLEPEFHPLFSQQILAAARWRLDQVQPG